MPDGSPRLVPWKTLRVDTARSAGEHRTCLRIMVPVLVENVRLAFGASGWRPMNESSVASSDTDPSQVRCLAQRLGPVGKENHQPHGSTESRNVFIVPRIYRADAHVHGSPFPCLSERRTWFGSPRGGGR